MMARKYKCPLTTKGQHARNRYIEQEFEEVSYEEFVYMLGRLVNAVGWCWMCNCDNADMTSGNVCVWCSKECVKPGA